MKLKESLIGIFIVGLFLVAIFMNVDSKEPYNESQLSSQSIFPKKSIAVVELYGPIAFPQYSTTLMPTGANIILEQLYKIKEDKDIKGLVIRINSPGGTVAASQEIYAAIRAAKQALNIPVVAQIGDVGASGAYYAALGADTIFANSGSLVGSIGVIIGNLSIDDFAKKHGIDYNVYKSGQYKDILSMWRQPTESEQELLQDVIDNVFEQFKQAFIESRKISEEQASFLAQGQIFTGVQALDHQMVDRIGGYQDALTYIGELTGLGPNPHITYKVSYGWMDMFNIINNSFNNLSLDNTLAVPQLK